MTNVNPFMLLHGAPNPDPTPTPLRAGKFTMRYDKGALRYIEVGGVEVLRQIYAAVRAENWDTIGGRLSDVVLDIHDDHFHIEFLSTHQQGAIDFHWHGTLDGSADGVITLRFAGKAMSDFTSNRIGFCILHPLTSAGAACRNIQADGTVSEGHLPTAIAPHQPFKNIRAFQHEVSPGVWAEVATEGDIFEMEDQRNWTDASFKTYSTPLDRPLPQQITAGTRIEQTITLRLLDAASAPAPVEPAEAVELTLNPTPYALPALGVASRPNEALSALATTRLKQAQFQHVRVDIHPTHKNWREILQRAAEEAAQLGAALEIAVHAAGSVKNELGDVQQAAAELNVARWIIFNTYEGTTTQASAQAARDILGDAAFIIGGADSNFTDLNRKRTPTEALNGLVYMITPQIHAFDDATLIENLVTQTVTSQSAHTFAPEKSVHVSTVILGKRGMPMPQTGVPSYADPRQATLLGAVWALGSIKYLALGQTASITYFETTGYLGIMATAQGSADLAKFWAPAESVYPMYHVFADVGAFAGGELLDLQTADALRVDGFVLQRGTQQRVLLANTSPTVQHLYLTGVTGAFTLRRLDETNAEHAMREPEQYRALPEEHLSITEAGITLELLPYAILRLDKEG